jgi:hypothetical protein
MRAAQGLPAPLVPEVLDVVGQIKPRPGPTDRLSGEMKEVLAPAVFPIWDKASDAVWNDPSAERLGPDFLSLLRPRGVQETVDQSTGYAASTRLARR